MMPGRKILQDDCRLIPPCRRNLPYLETEFKRLLSKMIVIYAHRRDCDLYE